jgi:hypothetical protein
MRIVQHVSNWVAGTNSSTSTLYKRNTISTRITTWTTLPCHPPVTDRVRFKTWLGLEPGQRHRWLSESRVALNQAWDLSRIVSMDDIHDEIMTIHSRTPWCFTGRVRPVASSKVFFYTYVVLPLWKLFSPLFLPTCTAAISFSCLHSLLLRTRSSARLGEAYGCTHSPVWEILQHSFGWPLWVLIVFVHPEHSDEIWWKIPN